MIREPQITRDPLDLLLDTLEPVRDEANPAWHFVSQTLVVQHTLCDCCKRVYAAPLHILTKSTDGKASKQSTTYTKLPNHIPRKTKIIKTIVSHCQHCFGK